jgi:hypothetical protein
MFRAIFLFLGHRRCKCIVLGRGTSYFVKKQNSDPNKNATTDRPNCINCFLPLSDLFYYLYEAQNINHKTFIED